MKKLGIIGGTAWASTVDYYAAICRLSEAHFRDLQVEGIPPTPEMAIESLDHRTAVSYIGTIGDERSWARFDGYHRDALLRLAASGAQVALLASNTPHYRFGAITSGVPIPVVNIFEATAAECARTGADDVLILGTALTMETNALGDALMRRGIASFVPERSERAKVLDVIERLQRLAFDQTAQDIHAIAAAAFVRRPSHRRAICLACTELPLAFGERRFEKTFQNGDYRCINSSAIHAAAAFQEVLG